MPTRLAADARLGDALTTTGGTTLLSYALLDQPQPAPGRRADATLTLVVSNDGSQIVDCTQIMVILPVGSNAKDLTADAGLLTQVPAGWDATGIGGVVTLTPDTPPAQIGREGLAFVVSGFGDQRPAGHGRRDDRRDGLGAAGQPDAASARGRSRCRSSRRSSPSAP